MQQTRDVMGRIDVLRRKIASHDRAYYVMNTPSISDQEYDELVTELARLEEHHPGLVDKDSPTQRVYSDCIKSFPKGNHSSPMLSLGNTYETNVLDVFVSKLFRTLDHPTVLVEPKIDGLALAIKYQDGRLLQAITRGDGNTGDDVTLNVRAIRCVPLKIDYAGFLEVRGEVYWKLADFEKYGQEMANPRNGAAGTLKLLDPKEVWKRHLSFVAHSVGSSTAHTNKKIRSEADALQLFSSLGIPCVPFEVCKDASEVLDAVRVIEVTRPEGYAIDGAVVKINEFSFREVIGETSKAPRWATAFKYATMEATTVLQSVSFQVGRNGTITPVANLRPVALSGSTVSRASLHNFDQVAELGLHIGDEIVVEKAGEIIPYVTRVSKQAASGQKITPPKQCPECHSPVQRNGAFLQCQNLCCPAQEVRRLIHWCAKDQMDINGLGAGGLDQIYDAGLAKKPTDLYLLEVEQLLRLEGWGLTKARKAIRGIAASKEQPLSRVLASLGLRHIGNTASKALAKEFGSMAKLVVYCTTHADPPDSIGPAAYACLRPWILQEQHKTIAELRDLGLTLEEPQKQAVGGLSGEVVVFTGTLSQPRSAAQKAAEEAGASIASSVSKTVTLVVAGEDAGSKLDKAHKLGIPVINEEEFNSRL